MKTITNTRFDEERALYGAQNGRQMTQEQRALLAGMMETIWEDEA